MRVTPPLEITDTILTSSTAAEPGPGETAWVSGATYALGDRRFLAATHTIYERLVAGAGTISPDADAINWAVVGPTNRWRMFDVLQNTSTVLASPLSVVLEPAEPVDTIALIGVEADSVTITGVIDGNVVFSQTEDLTERQVVDWYGYFFAPFSFRTTVYIFNLPPLDGLEITVDILRDGGEVSCASLVVGSTVDLGKTLQGAELGALNFSEITRDFVGGVASLVQRRSVPKLTAQTITSKSNVNIVRKARADLNARPGLWALIDSQLDAYFDGALVLGFYKTFNISLDQPGLDLATIALEIEEF